MKKLSLGISICAAAFIIGCGGGGGGSSSSSASNTNNSGEATDELMVNADVTIYAGSKSGKVLAKTKTDENGTYNVTLNYKGPILVEVKCNENTTLKDFNGTDLGECNLTTPLYSANIIEDSNNIITAATPFSTAVVYAATEGNLSKTITKEALQKAKLAVAYAYNLNIDPISINPSQSEIYKNKIQTFDNLDSNHTALIEQIIEDAKDGAIGDDLNSSLKNDLNVTEVNASDVNISAGPILTAKATFDALRTTINNISNPDETGSVDLEVKKISDDFRNITVDTEAAINPLGTIISMISEHKTFEPIEDGNITINTDDNQTFTYTIDKNDTNFTGQIVFNDDLYQDVDFNTNFEYEANITNAELPYNEENLNKKQYLSAKLKLTNDSSNKVVNLLFNDIKLSSDEENLSIDKVDASIKYDIDENNEPQPKYVKISTIQLSGNVLDKYDANVTINVSYTKTANTDVPMDLEFVELEGGVDCENEYGEPIGKPNGTIKYQIADGTWVTLPIVNSWSNGVWFYKELNSEDFAGIGDDRFDLSEMSCDNGNPHIFETDYYYTDEFYNGGVVPNKISINGDIKDLNNSMELIGNITVQSPDINEIDVIKDNQHFYIDTTADVLLKRPNYADTELYIHGTYKSDKDPRKLEINFKYGDYDYIDVLGQWGANTQAGTVTITGLNGFRTTIPVNEEGNIDFTNPIPVYVNNEKVGELQRNGDIYRIKYNDDTFELLQ